jgi:hypothetical protein
MDANQLFLQLQQHFPRGIAAANQKVYSGSPAVPRAEPPKQTPPTFSQWGATPTPSTQLPAASAGAQASVTPQAFNAATPQFGYYQTHQDSITTAVQNFAYQRQQQQLQQQKQQQNYRS